LYRHSKNSIHLADTHLLSKSNGIMKYHEFDFIECYDDDYDFDDDEQYLVKDHPSFQACLEL
jgi:hypothetical protein